MHTFANQFGCAICPFDCKTFRKIALFWQPPLALHARCLSLVNYLALPAWASLLPYTFLQLVTCNCLYCYQRFKSLTFFLFQLLFQLPLFDLQHGNLKFALSRILVSHFPTGFEIYYTQSLLIRTTAK